MVGASDGPPRQFPPRACRQTVLSTFFSPLNLSPVTDSLSLHRNRVVTHGQILRESWGPKSEANTHYLRVHLTHLRQKLEADPHRPRHLKTESGIGYRLVEE